MFMRVKFFSQQKCSHVLHKACKVVGLSALPFLPRDALYSAKCGIAMSSACPSVTLMDQDHIGWKSWKLITRTISPDADDACR